jgi:UDP-N-acetylmuramate dehydrogenase
MANGLPCRAWRVGALNFLAQWERTVRFLYSMGMNNLPFDFAVADYPLRSQTLYNIGGPARIALLPENAEQAEQAFLWMCEQSLPRLILGGGANVLISDKGFPGIVFLTRELKGCNALGNHRYHIDAGLDLDQLVQNVMLARNYGGVGALTGIPGSVGGAIYMNAGTVNGSTCEFMTSVELLNQSGCRTVSMTKGAFGYRHQAFCKPGDLILGGTFQFAPVEEDQQAIYDHYIQRRLQKQPQAHCCGSVFKNPDGHHAGNLIESCGLKGQRLGGAQISPLHANFIMNEENASFEDILALIEMAKTAVQRQFSITLEEEVRIIQ